MTYWVFTPALFVASISRADLDVVPVGSLLVCLVAPIVVVAASALALGRAIRADGPQVTSLVQGSIRVNTYIGLIFASAVHGATGVAVFAIASAIVVPLVNIICVSVLSSCGRVDAAVRKPRVWRDLAFNPLILSCLAGTGLNVLQVPLPTVLSSSLTLLSAPALAAGTLIAGAALRLTFERRDLVDVALASALKLVALPLGAGALAAWLGVSGVELFVVVLICAVPTAPSAYILATKMGGDARLMATITGVQTVLSIVSIPALLAFVGSFTPTA
nr:MULTISPECIES: AEC family transporter [unclassified Microbacterium]